MIGQRAARESHGCRHSTAERVETAPHWSAYSDVPEPARTGCLAECFALTDAIFPGLDVESEIRAVAEQGLGETILLSEGRKLVAFAVVHIGKGSEAGSG